MPVKVLGAFCMLDQGEIDWKILALNKKEAEATGIDSFAAYLAKNPSMDRTILNWFRYIKVYDGKKPNEVLFDGKIHDVKAALQVIEET